MAQIQGGRVRVKQKPVVQRRPVSGGVNVAQLKNALKATVKAEMTKAGAASAEWPHELKPVLGVITTPAGATGMDIPAATTGTIIIEFDPGQDVAPGYRLVWDERAAASRNVQIAISQIVAGNGDNMLGSGEAEMDLGAFIAKYGPNGFRIPVGFGPNTPLTITGRIVAAAHATAATLVPLACVPPASAEEHYKRITGQR